MSRAYFLSAAFLAITATTSLAQDENTVWLPGLARDGGNLGRVVSAGDISGDGIDDLLAATLFASPGSVNNKSQFQAILGSKSGLQGDTLVHTAVYPPDLIDIDPGVSIGLSFVGPSFLIGSPPASNAFNTKTSSSGGSGSCTRPTDGGKYGTTSGDYDGDGETDIILGCPGRGLLMFFSSTFGRFPNTDTLWGPQFDPRRQGLDIGSAFATGDFNGDGIDDLAVGTPLDAVKENAEGTVVIVPGAPGDIATKQSQIYNCAKSLGIRCEPQLRFGYALAIYGSNDGLDLKTRTLAFRSTTSIGFASHRSTEDVDTVLVPMLGTAPDKSDEDAFGRRIELKSFSQPEQGTVTFVDTLINYIDRDGQLVEEGMRGALRFTPEPDFNGFLEVEYTIGPPDELTAVPNVADFATGRFSIRVTRVNDPPYFITTSDSIDSQATVGVPFEAVILYGDIDSIPVVGVQTQPSWLSFQVETFEKQMTVSGTPEIGDIGSARLRVVLTDEEFAVSEDFFFGVSLNPPAAPLLLDPKDGEEGLSRPVTISWAGAPLATTYRVQVATSDVFMTALGANQQSANVIVDTTGIADTLLVLQTLEGGTQYFWRVTGTNLAGEGEFSAPFTFTTAPGVANENPDQVPTFALGQNYPNPFAGKTNISFSLDATSHAELVVFDSFGRIVRRLADGVRAAGSHTILFDAQGLSGGVYFVRLKASGREAVATLTLVK